MSNNVVHKTKTIVLTGSTGTFGRYLASELVKYEDVQVILLVRGKTQEEAQKRVNDIIGRQHERVDVFKSDLTERYAGLSEADYKNIALRTTHILHAAASIRFTLPLEEARISNVKTTEAMIEFAQQCPNLVRFGFVSTALVAGKRTGIIKEDEFEHSAGFKNTYEQTKYEAEALVRACLGKLPMVTFRPPLIITPKVPKDIKGPLNFLPILISLLARGYLPFVPGSEKSTMDVVDSFDASRIIIKLFLKKHLSYTTYHVTNGVKCPIVGLFHRMIEDRLGKQIVIEYCGSMESCWKQVRKLTTIKPELQRVYERASSFLPESAYPKIFDNRNTLSELTIKTIGRDPVGILRLAIDKTLWNY